ncbi:Inositol-1,4,5-triphosphate 5-phosphatase (synaptojanin), INP51/INP52/INP53 family [Ceraceosorus bombacis]|uniref:Inositol-1,4,5-triphosphate 5-phosphatase (Synaptojanin), INP51/INP52/INP53 family n=1 Tax=Ceraceosorus bombacis TaxID=401625 RepID=A0A0N7L977_9BASI|nr:Inositol-1,4,5-triphosphate 5-phosphatase (synaptojanin), INP51/INP52/INP53 family [Ceraceosorus bombacis]
MSSALRVQIGTFNYNLQGTSAYAPDLSPWLVPTLSERSSQYNASNPSEGRPAPDFYAVGFQELLPLDLGFAGKATQALSSTDTAIRRAIRPQSATTRSDGKYPPGGGPENYALVARVQLVSIVLYVYARERVDAGSHAPSIAQRVKEVRTSTAAFGLLGLMGNKGATGVRVVLAGATPGSPDEVLTFVCAHLTAHDHNVAKRNADWRNIVQRLVFAPDAVQGLPSSSPSGPQGGGRAGDANPDVDALSKQYQAEKESSAKRSAEKATALDQQDHSIYDTSHLFVFGDLNYRIAFNTKPAAHLKADGEALKKSDIKRKVQQADWRTLAAYDQLSLDHRHPSGSRVFQGLVEPHLPTAGFGPTYKFKVDKSKRGKNAAQGDIDADEKSSQGAAAQPAQPQELSGKRVPGWTDRILWLSLGTAADEKTSDASSLHGVQTELYRSIMSYTHSDHKPVTAILRLPSPSRLAPGGEAALQPLKAPYPIDGAWRTKRLIGQTLDSLLGLAWSSLIAAGAGSLITGLLELAVIVALSAYWLSAGGGSRGDLGWILGGFAK